MLGTTAEHALRALTTLAALPDGAVMMGRRLAETTSIPANYLSKILWTLRKAGIIDATRGNRGGYRLAKPPAEIRVFEVVYLFDKAAAKVNCLFGNRECSDDNACPAHRDWRNVRNAYMEFMAETTIADFARSANGKHTRKSENRL